MNLTPEERDVGKENFRAAIGSEYIRQKFLRESAENKLATKKGMGPYYFKYGEVKDPVRIGIIGTGDEGGVLIGAINPKYVKVVAIADIRPYNVYRAFHGDKSSPNTKHVRPGLMNIYGWPNEETARQNVKVFTDGYEKLLDDPNVEAVIIALPLHLHAAATVKAMRKGKHVLCEKLMAHSVAQCKEMARVAKETEKLLAIGHQRHYSVLYDNALAVIKAGLIGDIHHIRAQWHRGNLPGKDSWQQPLPDAKMQQELDESIANLAEADQKWEHAKQQAKEKLRAKGDEKTLALLAKWDKEYATLQQLKQDLAALLKQKNPDEAAHEKMAKEISRLAGRRPAIDKQYPRRLGLDKNLAKKLNVPGFKDRVELLQNRIKDAEVAEAVKDHGYIDRVVGGKKVSALEELIRWRLWERTGGGLMAELGSHQMDAAGIFISASRDDGKKVLPLSVSAVGGRHIFPHDRDIEDHVYCSFEYPGPKFDQDPEKKIVVSYSSINGNGYGGYGESVFGTKGTLILDREKDVMLFKSANTTSALSVVTKKKKVKEKGPDGKDRTVEKVWFELTTDKGDAAAASLSEKAVPMPASRGYTEEIEHWAWAIRTGTSDLPHRCGPKVALADAVIALVTNQVMRNPEIGRLAFNPEWFDPESDETPEGVKPDVKRKEYS